MCQKIMDTQSKRVKSDCLRKTMKHGSKLGWKLIRVSAEEEDEALKPWRASAVKATVRKYLRREQKRAQLAKLAKALGDVGKREKKQSAYEENTAVAYMHSHPAGAMAPENTTQYLMRNVYDDLLRQPENNLQSAPVSPCEVSSRVGLYDESLSPRSVYNALDSGYESCLAFQQRDFEEEFGMLW